jgi:uncharacterized protein (DUF433 family)
MNKPMPSRKRDHAGRITINPNIFVGKRVITGARIPVYPILNLTAHGYDLDQIIESYPNLTHHDIKAALYYACKVLEEPPGNPYQVSWR